MTRPQRQQKATGTSPRAATPAKQPSSAPSPTPSLSPGSSTPNKQLRDLRRAHVSRYFDDSSKWDFNAFAQYCRDNKDYVWTDANIGHFWASNLRHLRHNGSAEEKRRAGVILRAEEKGKMKAKERVRTTATSTTNKTSFVFNGPLSEVGNIGVVGGGGSPSPSIPTRGEAGEARPPQPAAPFVTRPTWPEELRPPDEFLLDDKTPIDTWCSAVPAKGNFKTLLRMGIIDLDAMSKKYPKEHKALQRFILKLPPTTDTVEYALGRFNGVTGMTSFILATETSPRRPNQPPTPDTYVATYLNRCISHWLTCVTKFRGAHCIWATLKEGFLDIIWGFTLDDLWNGGAQPGLYIARKELLCHVPGITNKFDGLFRYLDDGQAFDVGVAEASITPANVNNDAKAEYDVGKMQRAMVGMLWVLAEKVGWHWEVVRRVQVFGFITSGWTLTIHRMHFVTRGYCAVKRTDAFVIRLHLEGQPAMVDMLRMLTRVKAAMEETVKLVLEHSRRGSF